MKSLILLTRESPIAVVMLNRPEALNALSPALVQELVENLEALDRDPTTRVMILTGGDKVFAAGADIKEMAGLSATEMKKKDLIGNWDRIYKIKKPIIAAVSGYCFGGGCEVVMMCDMIIASETAKFGQLEINLGIMPGAGGTQRLTHAIGKYKSMEWVLTGNVYSAQEAYAAGLVNKVVPAGECLNEAKKLAQKIAEKSPIAIRRAKEAILKALELPLEKGLKEERELLYGLFDTEDQKEGMKAFLEKRPPNFKGQ